jgi:lipopolysaccharide transport system ATP-binding protein
VRISVRFEEAVARPSVGFVLRDRLGTDLAGTSTLLEGVDLPPAPAGAIYTVRLRMALPPLHPGNYALSPTIADGDLTDYTMCDWIENALVVQIGGRYRTGCLMHPPVTAELEGVYDAATAAGVPARG